VIFSPEDFAATANVSRETLDRLKLYADLLTRWQTKINLIAPATIPQLWHRHMLDSAQLLPLIPATARRLLDFGSGAGFPGLVVALCLGTARAARIDLYESDQRKSVFLAEVIRQTGAPARILTQRIEDATDKTADLVMARALAPLPKLLALAERVWHPGMTGLFLKGRELDKEIDSCRDHWRFAYDRVPSATDSAASILLVRSLSRV
jgi:16S rRNA (guanine527-N7)-methyltransferase